MPEFPDPRDTAPPPRRFWRIVAISVGTLVTVVTLAGLFENWRGQRAWNQFRAEWEAKGERFDLASSIPQPVPYEENFATTPLLAPLLDYYRAPGQPVRWNNPKGNERARALGSPFSNDRKRKMPPFGQWQAATFTDLEQWQIYFDGHTNFPFSTAVGDPARDVLTALQKFDAELEELVAASARPHSVFAIRYQENFNALLPHLTVIKGIAQIARLRASARLVAGEQAGALQDVKLALRLADALKREPTLISHLVRIAIIQIVVQPVWEGTCRHDWTEEQLADLQAALANVKVLEDFGPAIRGERAMGNAAVEQLRTGKLSLSNITDGDSGGFPTFAGRFIPSGWFYQNQVTLNRLYQERCLPLVDAGQHRAFPEKMAAADEAPELKHSGIYNIFARLLFPAVAKAASKFAYGQTTVDLAIVACALERHRLANGRYPDSLDPLVPKFIARVPVDIITGELLKYRQEADDTFVLYSVGWNLVDDGGETHARKEGSAPDPAKGDWVWRQAKP